MITMIRPPKANLFGMLLALVFISCLGAAHARTCGTHQFWSSFFNKCMNCTDCVHPDLVISPCQVHRDTVCGPLQDLHIDWKLMKHGVEPKNEPVKEMTETFKENMKEIKMHEMHVKEKMELLRKLQDSKIYPKIDDLPDVSKQELFNKLKSLSKEKELSRDLAVNDIRSDSEPWKALHFDSEEAKALLKSAARDSHLPTEPKHETPPEPTNKVKFGFFPDDSYEDDDDDDEEDSDDDDDDDDEDEDDEYKNEIIDDVSEQPVDFTRTERIVLDYQTGVLYVAVASVLIFFVVALCYSLKHLRTWSGRNYVEELEELQFWLTKKKDGKKQLPATIYKTTTEVVSEGTKGNCKYLERIISKNAKKKNRVPGNVYHAPHLSMETRPLTAYLEDPEVHKPVNI